MPRSLVLALLLTLALAAPALAQSPSQDGYTPDGIQALEQTEGSEGNDDGSDGDRSGPQSAATSTLPFTGVDLVLLAAFGAGLLGVGAGLRLLIRPADTASR